MKLIFHRIVNLVRMPQEEWMAIVNDTPDVRSIRRKYFYPFIIAVLIAAIYRFSVSFNWVEMQKFSDFLSSFSVQMILVFTSVFGGVYLNTVLVMLLMQKSNLDEHKKMYNSFTLVVYSSSISWVIMIINSFLPSLFFLPILNLYIMYVVWCGLPIFFTTLSEKGRNYMAIIILLLLIGVPMLIEKILTLLMK